VIAALAGLVIGVFFGAVVQRTNFCTMGAVSDIVVFGDWRRFRSWLLAIATAIAGTQFLAGYGLIDLQASIYAGAEISLGGTILGGLLFGLGMVFAGGCGSRNLVRLGAGDLRALVVLLFLGLSAAMAIHGLTAPARASFNEFTTIDLETRGLSSQALAPILAEISGGNDISVWNKGLALALPLLIALFCLASGLFRRSWKDVLAGLAIGFLVIAGWWATGILAADEFEPQPFVSLTFVAPVGDSLLYLMTFTGIRSGPRWVPGGSCQRDFPS
jgi:uncharacterized membrane protein YedE/YeeE